ncbi:prepilin peptidase CpaA [Palleronia salina]|uniref:Prepilin peptidase CpaA n=2 Tax=Palleronia TaxID=315422 RepID=A0A1M6EWU0_9RHOB|nr:prepilin peptidase CpaA [Palleronia pelagia]SHI89892.1 prepilin peptidase CpaA [Palleronia salina]
MNGLADIAEALMLPDRAALAFLPFVTPICIWVAWSDMARMKIPNKAVMALFLVYLLIGPLVLPLELYAWQFLHLAVVLVAGFVLNMGGALGAGDAKFAAAAAPFVLLPDALTLLYLFAAITLAAFATHRLARATPAIRSRTPEWVSWTSAKFPMGLALAPALLFYLVLAAI